jgi:tRNA G18 (ribose-2'-O)-methylase SpoU
MNDTRNVADKYKGWMEELIKEDLDKKAFPYACLMEQWQGDFNIGTMVRNANAFGAKEVFYIGERRKWDKRGSVGTYKYTSVNFLPSFEALLELKKDYYFIGIDNIPGPDLVSLKDCVWPIESLMIFGEEGIGLTPRMQELCDMMVEIPMYGSVRSLNAGCTSAIIMNDYVTKRAACP